MSSLTLTKAWQKFYHNFSSKQIIGKTDLGYWTNHIVPYFQSCLLSDITTQDIMKFRNHIEDKQLSPQTVHHCLALIKRIFNKMRLIGEYDAQMPHFFMPTYDNKRIRFLTKDEADLLLCVIRSQSELWFNISLFALNTGLRASEIFKLYCHNINFNTSSVYIFNTKNASNRCVPLNQKSKQIVEKFYTNPGNYLFLNNGKRITQASKIFFTAVKQSGLNSNITDRRQKIVFHSLRHTFASWLIQNDVPIEVVSKLLGHKSINITQRYAHIVAKQERHAVNLLDIF